MKKHLYLLSLILCLALSACGTTPAGASKEQSNASLTHAPGFETDVITLYDITMGESWVVTDKNCISEIAASAQIDSWKALTELGDQVSAVPVYAFDFGNGTCIGLLGDGYILVGTAFEYLSEDHQSYRIVDSCQYQVPVEFTDLLKEITVSATEMEELPAETVEISVPTPEEPAEIPEDSLVTDVTSVPASEDPVDTSLVSLMTEFMNGGLEGCLFNDGSEASAHFQAWSEMLGGEEISLESETPQSYWESWCAHVENLYARNGYDFFIEQDYPVSGKYIELKYGTDG